MAVNEDVSAYSNAAASNTPAGGDTVGPDLDNHLRDMKKNIRQVAENFITVSDENFKGRIKTDTAGSTHTLKYFADSGDMSLFQVDDSASSVTVFIDDVVMGAAAKGFNKETTTASALAALNLTVGTVGGQLLAETGTASARTRLDLGSAALETVGTAIGNVIELVTGSATSAASLPAVYGDKLLGIAGGKILQIVQTTKTDTFTTTSTSYTDVTGMSVKILPINVVNKVLVFVGMGTLGSAGNQATHTKLVRNSTDIFVGDSAGSRTVASTSISKSSDVFSHSASIGPVLDTPSASTTATYKLQMSVSAGTGGLNRTTLDTDAALYPRSASSIIVAEIET